MNIKRFVGGLLESNGYIISCSVPGDKGNKTSKGSKAGKGNNIGKDCYIIDPGYNPNKFIKYINDEGMNLKGIILTHHHYDHTGAVDKVKKEFGCPVMMHAADVDMYKAPVDVYLYDGDVIKLEASDENGQKYSDKLVVYNTPGHTHGSICLMSSKSKLCFTGDTIFNVDIGRIDLEDGSESEMINSIKNIVNTWSNDITIYPGHGDSATMKSVRKNNSEFLYVIERC